LISPIVGKCFSEMIDIWEYKFCIGESIDQYNTKNYSEVYNIGSLKEKMESTVTL
jgi:hypothetical protein